MNASASRIPEPLRAQLVDAIAQLLLEDLERFPSLPVDGVHVDDAGEERRPA